MATEKKQPPKRKPNSRPEAGTPSTKPKPVKRPPAADLGAMERAVAANLERLRRLDAIDPDRESLCELALTLARTLDDGAGMAVAAVARELRATLDDLVRSEAPVDDSIAQFVAALSTPTRNTTH